MERVVALLALYSVVVYALGYVIETKIERLVTLLCGLLLDRALLESVGHLQLSSWEG